MGQQDMRATISSALKDAMKAKDATRLGTLRLINAAIKDQDIALRENGKEVGDPEILAILGKMVKQRQESARAYEEGGSLELAEREQAEIKIIEDFLPALLLMFTVCPFAVVATGYLWRLLPRRVRNRAAARSNPATSSRPISNPDASLPPTGASAPSMRSSAIAGTP